MFTQLETRGIPLIPAGPFVKSRMLLINTRTISATPKVAIAK